MVSKLYECDRPGCIRIATHIVGSNLQVCSKCYNNRHYLNLESGKRKDKDPHKSPLTTHKMEKIVETYLDLAEAVQNAGGSVSVIKDHRDKPLSEFLEDICSTNNIRFRHDRNGS